VKFRPLILITLSVVFSAVSLSACMSVKPAPAPVDMHTSKNSLDWSGAYAGVLPCADCPGIKTRLTLNRDGSYELSQQYLERQPAPTTVRGSFSWNAAGNAVALDAAGAGQQFAVGEGRLTQLNRDGTRDASNPPSRVLTAVPLAKSLGQTLEDHLWTLESATDSQGRRIDAVSLPQKRPVVFGFTESRVSIQGTCNRLFGGYRINADGTFEVQQMASGMMACEPALMQGDTALVNLTSKPMKVELTPGPTLRLSSAANGTLVLSGQMTPEARYGEPTRVFLEVAPQHVACNHPLMPDAKCLAVRERQFDAQGLRVGVPGEFQPMNERIEGFTHNVGERNVLRLKRFTRSPVPADASAYVYVLDLVVETETVPR
jgi:heat shock protein HslJ